RLVRQVHPFCSRLWGRGLEQRIEPMIAQPCRFQWPETEGTVQVGLEEGFELRVGFLGLSPGSERKSQGAGGQSPPDAGSVHGRFAGTVPKCRNVGQAVSRALAVSECRRAGHRQRGAGRGVESFTKTLPDFTKFNEDQAVQPRINANEREKRR